MSGITNRSSLILKIHLSKKGILSSVLKSLAYLNEPIPIFLAALKNFSIPFFSCGKSAIKSGLAEQCLSLIYNRGISVELFDHVTSDPTTHQVDRLVKVIRDSLLKLLVNGKYFYMPLDYLCSYGHTKSTDWRFFV